jgi:hypothetical protein
MSDDDENIFITYLYIGEHECKSLLKPIFAYHMYSCMDIQSRLQRIVCIALQCFHLTRINV